MTDRELLQSIYENMNSVKDDVNDMKADIIDMKSDIESLQSETTTIQMTLEDVTNKNIQIIAEGHLDLNNKLNDALRSEKEKELLLIRVNYMENELKALKQRIESIA